MRLRTKLALVFSLLSLLIVGGLGYVAYHAGHRAIRQNVSDQLLDMNLLKEAEIERWIMSNERSLRELAQRPLVREYSTRLISNELSEPELLDTRMLLVTDHLLPALDAAGGFLDLSILHPSTGKILASTDETLVGKYRQSKEYFVQGRLETYTGSVAYELTAAEAVMHVATPIPQAAGNLSGVLVAHADLLEISEITMQRRGFAIKEDTYLVNKFNFFVTEPAFGDDYALRRAVYTNGVALALEGGAGVAFYDDYRGERVLGAYRWLEERELAIITEISVSEAFAPVVRLRNSITGVGAAAALISVLLSFLFARRITKRLQELSGGLEEVAGGDLSTRIRSLTRDEVGSLGRSFNKMAERLEMTTASRDDLAREIGERKRAEELYRLLATHTTDVIWMATLDGQFTYVSPSVEKLRGYTSEEVMQQPMAAAHTPESMERTAAALQELSELVALGEPFVFERHYELEQTCKDGSTVWTESAVSAMHDIDGSFLGILGVSRDVTNRRRVEAAIAAREKQYRGSLDNLNVGVVSHAPDSTIICSNRLARSILGLTMDQMLGKTAMDPYWKFLNEDGTDMALEDFPVNLALAARAELSHCIVGIIRGENEAVRWVVCNGHSVMDEEGELSHVLISFVDVTEHRQAENELQASTLFMEGMLEQSPMPTFIFDTDGICTKMNRAFVDFYGIPEGMSISGVNVLTFPPNIEQGTVPYMQQALQGEVVRTPEMEFRSPGDGKLTVTKSTLFPIRAPSGEMTHVVVMQEDVTERRKAEEEKLAIEAHLRQAQKLESIGTLAGGVAHEINNPLMGMINYADLIGDEVEDETIKDYSQIIMKEGSRIATIVRNLLSFSRQDKETHSPADIKDIIDRSLSLVGSVLRKEQITIELDVAEELPKVKCRSQQIQQVIMNLLTNAHDALNVRYPDYDEDKILRITARLFERAGEDWIRTTVEDHGSGIPEDMMQRIFDPFYTTKSRDKGTGLGLSVSFGIVKEHHGELTVESVPGEYTRFHVDLRINNGWRHRDNQEDAAELGKMGE